MSYIKDILLVGCGGFLGASARYIVYLLTAYLQIEKIFLATLIVNCVGSFLIGFLALGIKENDTWRLFLIVGLLGGFTTFSTFSQETFTLLAQKQFLLASVNIVLNVLICLFAVFAGFKIAKTLFA